MRLFYICLLSAALAACNDQPKQGAHTSKERLDAVDSITGIANWQLADGQDTSYLYFSRMGDALIHVYHFSIEKGDTVNTRMNNIVARQDTVIWDRGDKQLLLASADGVTARWEDINNRKDAYILQKTDSQHISILFPDGHKATMRLTLPLSTFLVRQKYDYQHATSYSDSALVKPRGVR